ncbi:BEACH domain-containing protein [Cavenderia fasciculata]|uniref:Sulfiredoxin n=1 Tax=Cavenderia fasciculata TaxID=261658 RepID=F4Q6T6_CACFS|nr:BEACH domain-containing protein [Cavenderia fasciculata]EGG16596.1 BEACH domain-containing protein [Cavenderia fasciculata]|eukprot:XP_004354996.1 BEACH domain-containing protein [Cavenderia fasciculata]
MSIYTRLISETVIPMSVIHRPIPSVLDESKVKSLMATIETEGDNPDLVPPIDVKWIVGRDPQNNYYFAFGGCHRFEAHKRLGLPTIRARIVKSTREEIKVYLGSSTPDFP